MDARAIDAPEPDAMVPFAPWNTPVVVPGLASALSEDDPTLTGDMLEIYFQRGNDIYYATRANVTDAWSSPQPLNPANVSSAIQTTPEITLDGLELFFSSNRSGNTDIYVLTRPNRAAQFSGLVPVGELNTAFEDVTPTAVGNAALVMYMSSTRMGGAGGYDLYRTTRPSRAQAWAPPVRIDELATIGTETEPWVDTTETTMYMSADGPGGRDIFVSTRATSASPWTARALVDELNSFGSEEDPWISPDGHTIYFMSNRAGNADLYMATR